jgi:hypothetical protein
MSDMQLFDAILGAKMDSIQVERDADGHMRVLLEGAELEKVNAFLSEELNRAYDDYSPMWMNAVENIETYKAIRKMIEDSGLAMYPAPIARIPADQVIAATYNSVMRPRPIISIDAYLNASYDVPGVAGAPTPQPGMPVPTQSVTAEEIGKNLRQGYEFLARERIQIGPKLLKAIGNAVKGCPSYWKVAVNPDQVTKLTARADGGAVTTSVRYESTRMRGDIVAHYLVPYFNCMKPLDQDDIQICDWFAEREKHNRPEDILTEYVAKTLFLIKDDAEVKALANSTVDIYDPYRERIAASTEKKPPAQKPTQVCDRWEVWFYWTAQFKDPESGQSAVKQLNCVGSFHRSAGKLMSCFLNEYEHQERPYELIDQFDDGGSTVENMRYHQNVFTHTVQAEIKNAFIANNVALWHDPDNPDIVSFFTSHKVLKPGDHIPGVFGKDWGVAVMGQDHDSMMPLIQFILSFSQLDSKQNKYSSGDPGGRTPANTMAMAIEQAGQEPHLFLHRLSTKLSRIFRLDMETRRQFQPLGEVLPSWTGKEKTEIPFRFPVGDVLDNFRIALTASDEALAREQDQQNIMAQKKALMDDGEYVAKILGAIMNLQTPLPKEGVDAFAKIIKRDQKALMDLLGNSTTDVDQYDLTPEVDALLAARNRQLEAQQAMQRELQHAQAVSGTSPQQQAAQPDIKISLSGKLTPEQEAQAAAQRGLGGSNAQGQAAGPGPAVPGPGGPGGAGVAPPTGGQPGVPPPPPTAPVQGGQGVGGAVQ